MVKSCYFNELSSLFSPTFMNLIIENKYKDKLFSILKRSGYIESLNFDISLEDLYENLYSFLLKHYRCEYIYKNVIANKILLGRHSLRTATLISELRANSSKADVVILNGTSCVYEIKTELDSLNRLPSQLDDYSKIFDKIYVVTHEKFLGILEESLNCNIGIICLSEKYQLSEKRPAMSNKQNVDPVCIFNSLRKSEYTNIIRRKFGYIPNVPNTKIYDECLKLFCTLESSVAHDEMVTELKNRNKKNRNEELIKSIPHSLKFLCLDDRLISTKTAHLKEAFSAPALY